MLSSLALVGCPKKISSVSGSAGLSAENGSGASSPSSTGAQSSQANAGSSGKAGSDPSALSGASDGEAPISAPSPQEQAALEKGTQQGGNDHGPGSETPSHNRSGERSGFVVEAPGPKFSTNVYFDFDKWFIRSDTKDVLGENALWLMKHSDVEIQIEGHGDERGSNEYNLALGERRARSTRRYLINLGIDASRISFISYGEEKGVCNEKNEACYQKNRRAHFLVKR